MTDKNPKAPKKDVLIDTVTLVFLVVVGFIMSAITIPGFSRARMRANERACYANQKKIAAAIEMNSLDKGPPVVALDEETVAWFQKKGYIQRIPNDPGQGRNSSSNYILCNNEIVCLVHGSIMGIKGNNPLTPHEELVLRAEKDEQVLARAAKTRIRTYWSNYYINPFFDIMLISFFWLIFRLLSSGVNAAKSRYEYIRYGTPYE